MVHGPFDAGPTPRASGVSPPTSVSTRVSDVPQGTAQSEPQPDVPPTHAALSSRMSGRAGGQAAAAATPAAVLAPLPPLKLRRSQVEAYSAAAPRRRTQTASMWSVVSGSSYCQVTTDGTCVTDGDGDYGVDEQCTVSAEVALVVSAQGDFSTELDWDYVTIGSTSYSGTTAGRRMWRCVSGIRSHGIQRSGGESAADFFSVPLHHNYH
jgi:hypothetical protein